MPCIHLRELYALCEKHELRISSHDAIRVVCRQCQEQEVCPSSLTDGESVLKLPSVETSHEVEPASNDGPPNEPGARASDRRPR